MNKAYSYVRFSSPEQAKGRSEVRQINACIAYCKKHGLELVTDEDSTFLDRGRSAYKSEHVGEKGQLRRFLDKVKDKTIESGSYLIIESLDRLGREQIGQAHARLQELTQSGITVVTLTDEKQYTKDAGLIDLIGSILIMSRANEESSTKSRRVGYSMRGKQDDAREHGTPMGKQVPMWLTVAAGGFTVITQRAAVVGRIFQMAIDGYGKGVIAKALNADGIASFKGKTWGSSSVDKILNNRAVLSEYQPYSVQDSGGKRMPRGEPIKDYYPRVIDDRTFYAAHAAINERRVGKATKQSKNFNVWAGLAVCGVCGKPLHMVNKGKAPKGGTYLHCSGARKGLCKAKAVRLSRSEAVYKEILAKLDSLALVQDSAAKTGKDLAAVDGRLSEQREKLRQFKADLKARYSSVVSELVHESEQEVKGLLKEREALQEVLASQAITSKEDFFSKLDLVSYEGRARANGLMKRLKIQVRIHRTDSACHYVVKQGESAQMDITDTGEQIVGLPLNLGQMSKTRVQDLGKGSGLPAKHRKALGTLLDTLEEVVGTATPK